MKRGSSQLLLRASCFLYVLHGSSLALTFYSPFCWGDTLIYMDLCEPKSFEFLKTWRYMDIYEDTLPMGAPSIPNFICTHSPSIFLDFQGVSAFSVLAVTPFLHHFRIWLYWFGKPHAHRVLSDQVIHLRSPQHCFHVPYVCQLVAPVCGASIQLKTTMQGIGLTSERRILPMTN